MSTSLHSYRQFRGYWCGPGAVHINYRYILLDRPEATVWNCIQIAAVGLNEVCVSYKHVTNWGNSDGQDYSSLLADYCTQSGMIAWEWTVDWKWCRKKRTWSTVFEAAASACAWRVMKDATKKLSWRFSVLAECRIAHLQNSTSQLRYRSIEVAWCRALKHTRILKCTSLTCIIRHFSNITSPFVPLLRLQIWTHRK
jgi:hypothetical protein